jgi:hypothetical protein
VPWWLILPEFNSAAASFEFEMGETVGYSRYIIRSCAVQSAHNLTFYDESLFLRSLKQECKLLFVQNMFIIIMMRLFYNLTVGKV